MGTLNNFSIQLSVFPVDGSKILILHYTFFRAVHKINDTISRGRHELKREMHDFPFLSLYSPRLRAKTVFFFSLTALKCRALCHYRKQLTPLMLINNRIIFMIGFRYQLFMPFLRTIL